MRTDTILIANDEEVPGTSDTIMMAPELMITVALRCPTGVRSQNRGTEKGLHDLISIVAASALSYRRPNEVHYTYQQPATAA